MCCSLEVFETVSKLFDDLCHCPFRRIEQFPFCSFALLSVLLERSRCLDSFAKFAGDGGLWECPWTIDASSQSKGHYRRHR